MVQREQYLNKSAGGVCVLLLIFLAACGPHSSSDGRQTYTYYNRDSIRVEIREGMLWRNNQLFTGVIYGLYPQSSDTVEKVCFREGQEAGEWKQWYPRTAPNTPQQLKEKRYFQGGKKADTLMAWWPNGQPKFRYYFKNGEYEGEAREWNPEGRLVKRMHYQQGHEEGVQQFFYDNGKVKANYVIRSGRRYGLLGTKNCVNVSDSIFRKLL